MAILCAKAQIRLPTRKTTFAKTMIDFLPQISLILPHRGIQAAFARRYDDAIHEKPLSEAPNCAAIVGRAVEIIVCKINVNDRSKGNQVSIHIPYPKLPRIEPTKYDIKLAFCTSRSFPASEGFLHIAPSSRQ